jgi:folylpolyglutamate synthase/dihydropteroate synthase
LTVANLLNDLVTLLRVAGGDLVADPKAEVEILTFTERGPVLAVRPYCNTAHYWYDDMVREGGLPINEKAIRRGLATAPWPGRLELLPAAHESEPDLLLDGAHNPDGCEMLAAYLRRHQSTRPRRVLLFAAMRDKPSDEMLRILKPVIHEVVVTGLPVARGSAPSDLERQAKDTGFAVTTDPDTGTSLALARRRAGAGSLVVASGSLYLVGEIRKQLGL